MHFSAAPGLREILAIVVALACMTAAPVSAQSIAGRVVLTDTTTGVGGAIVVATDSAGASVRALTNPRGRFSLRVPHTGRYDVQLLRIGYRPTKVPALLVASASEPTIVTLVAESSRILLSAMNVRSTSACRVQPDSGQLVARVWEEARKAMLASQLRADDQANGAEYIGEWMEYDRTMDSTGRIVRQQRVQSVRHPTRHVFKSLTADSLARAGYVVQDNSGIAFYAPDAEALLSESFVLTHCFRISESRDRDTTVIGVRFEPTRTRSGVHDIEGTLWVDRNSAELRTLEFRYTNFPPVADDVAGGGHVDFRRLSGGQWIIEAWAARFPVLGPRDRTNRAGTSRTVFAADNLVVRSLQQTGGEVARMLVGDSALLVREAAATRIQLVSRDPNVSVADATILLHGTDYNTATGPNGTARIGPLPAGRYIASVFIPQLDSLGAPPLQFEVVAQLGARVDSLELPRASVMLANVCPRSATDSGTAMLRGTVRDKDGKVLQHVPVAVQYQKVDARALKIGLVGWTYHTLTDSTNARGRWQMCGVPHETDLVISAESEAGLDRRRFRIADARMFDVVDLELRPDSSALRAVDSLARASVEFVVTSDSGAALPGVTLDVTMPDGVERTFVTVQSGRVLLPKSQTGRATVRARALGYASGLVTFVVAEGRNTAPIVLSRVAAPSLDTVRVVGGRSVSARLDGFETRRLNREASRSIARDEIERRSPVSAWQMLMDVPSIRVSPYGGGTYAMSARGKSPSLLDPGAPCPMQVAVDGTLLVPRDEHGINLNDLPPPSQIHGIEVFAGAARIPLQFGGSGDNKWCGLIAIWTRDR